MLENISKKIIYNDDSVFFTDHSVWDGFMAKNYSKPAIVKTSDIEYKGWLSANSIREEKKEIVLDKPAIVYTNIEGETEDFPCGEHIILFGNDIKSITILEENETQKP